MSRFVFIIFAAMSLTGFSASAAKLEFADPSVKEIGYLSKREVAAELRLGFTGKFSKEKWASCVPIESEPFPKSFSKEQKKLLFEEKEMEDLMKCSPEKCAFEFVPYERQYLQQLNSESQRQEAFYKFYDDRVSGRTPIAPKNQEHLIRSEHAKEAFPYCQSPNLDQLLDDRPTLGLPFRLAVARYDDRMRPTARLVQGRQYPSEGLECYAEALVFSDHYDVERVEIWALDQKGAEIRFFLRNRFDFLHSWFRRLQKGKLQTALEEEMLKQAKELQKCLLAAN